jgi:signal transduction histidine kinase/AraC-like DNA-binding protein
MMTYESDADVTELRHDALITLLVLSLIVWIAILAVGMIYAKMAADDWPFSPMLLVLVAILGARALSRRQRDTPAAWLLIGGLTGGPALFLTLEGPNYPVSFFLLLPIIAASVLLGGVAEFKVAGVVVLILIGTSAAWQPRLGGHVLIDTVASTWAPSFAALLTACIVHLNTRNILIMIRWAIDNQQKDARRAELFYAQSEQLKCAFQQLEYSNERLRLLNAELTEARRVAESANRLKTQFLANVSHELRTPLNIIMGHSRIALELPHAYDVALPPAFVQDQQHITHSAEHLLRLIDDLLDLSRAEIDALELFPETIDTRALLEEMFHSIMDGLTKSDAVQWQLDLPEYLPVIQADSVRLRQILLNLLSNAAKYTQRGKIELGAEVAPPHLHIWVADSGCGISVELQEHIFEPFVTSEQPGRRRQGIGLGLSIARRLVELHHGSMTLQSQPGQGSTFHVYLPLSTLESQPAALPETTNPILLVLSANEQLPAELIGLSQRQHATLRRLRAGERPQDALADGHPVGLVWDISAAQPTDWEIIQQLRSHPRLCRIPVILYGQQAANPDLTLGMTDFVIKPVSGDALVKAAHALRQPADTDPILVVDDDPEARDLYGRLLSTAFPENPIQLAENGAVALQLLEEETPKLVVLDLMMPEVDGFAVLKHLRAQPRTRQTPVLVLSGHMLSAKDVERLDYARVTFYTKDVLSADETVVQTRRILTGVQLPQHTSILVKQALAYIHQNYQQTLTRQDVAGHVRVSARYLSQIFTDELGISLWEYLCRYRVMHAKVLLRTTSESVTNVALQVGFDDPAYFSRVFRKETGRSPRAYRECPE